MEGLKITNKAYRAAVGVSSTDLKNLAKSPAHFRYWKDHPQQDTPALLFGRAVHKYVLEKEEFFSEFTVAPTFDRRTKEGKAGWLLFQEEVQNRDILSGEDFEKIKDMQEALYQTPFVKLLLSGEKEQSYFCQDEATGLTMKCRPDCRTKIGDTYILIDYKSTADADSEAFMKTSLKLMYDLQMAYYKHILDKLTGCDHSVIFIAQEKTPPYAVNILEADRYFLASGADMWRTYLDLYASCEQSGNWFGYVNDAINSLGLPNWLQKQYESVGAEE